MTVIHPGTRISLELSRDAKTATGLPVYVYTAVGEKRGPGFGLRSRGAQFALDLVCGAIRPKRPALKSSKASAIWASLFITKGP
jgi:hypothetical protein